jgi:GAF domain-containing protein
VVTAAAVELIEGADYAGITLVRKTHTHRRPDLEAAAPTNTVAADFDALQDEYGEGPCLDAVWSQNTVRIDDIAGGDRWPQLLTAVAQRTPIRSTLSIQLFTTGQELGALNLYSRTPHAFDETSEDLAVNLATHAAIALSGARRGQQFRSALASRDIIGQAKGMLMERFTIDALQAFNILRKLSQDTNMPLIQVATELVAADHPTATDMP